MTRGRLAEIRAADSRCRIHVDRFGGQYVLAGDARTYGQRAIIHRRQLLEFIEKHLDVLLPEAATQSEEDARHA